MDYYGHNDWRDYHLSHHGILGMHWGKKNGPPYPLSGSAHSASEKKAGWRKSLDGGGVGKTKYTGSSSAASSGGSGSVGSNREKSKNDIDSKIERAKKNDDFDREFLETVQNEDFFDDDDRMIKEYRKYLKNPKKYSTNGTASSNVAKTETPKTSNKVDRSAIDAKVRQAEKTDRYDRNFLETVQNDDRLLNDKKKLSKEYRKYLEDPKKYMTGSSEVKQTKPVSKTENKASSMSVKKVNERVNHAKKTGMYDIDFVEITQNKKFAYDDDDTTYNKEYRKYLMDPEKYRKTLDKRHRDY